MSTKHRRKPVTLSIAEDVIAASKALNINASQAAEQGIRTAIRTSKQDTWLRENKTAIDVYNRNVETSGLAFTPLWARKRP